MAVTLVPALPPSPGARDGQGRDRHPSKIPTVLVTNDDGIEAPGLATLAMAAAGIGRVVVAAPVDDRSGSGAAVVPAWLDEGILVSRVDDFDGVDGPAYSVHGPPSLAVLAGMSGALGPIPDLVVSGVNRGSNAGVGVLHSGTVGAALTAGNLRVSALAVSQVCVCVGAAVHLETAAVAAHAAMSWLLRAPAGTVLNLNVPDLAAADVAGVREAPLARFGTVEAPLGSLRPGQAGRMHVRIVARPDASDVRSDITLLAAGYVTATCLAGVRVSGRTGVAEALRSGLRAAGTRAAAQR
jgi:5'-nucleotidase